MGPQARAGPQGTNPVRGGSASGRGDVTDSSASQPPLRVPCWPCAAHRAPTPCDCMRCAPALSSSPKVHAGGPGQSPPLSAASASGSRRELQSSDPEAGPGPTARNLNLHNAHCTLPEWRHLVDVFAVDHARASGRMGVPLPAERSMPIIRALRYTICDVCRWREVSSTRAHEALGTLRAHERRSGSRMLLVSVLSSVPCPCLPADAPYIAAADALLRIARWGFDVF